MKNQNLLEKTLSSGMQVRTQMKAGQDLIEYALGPLVESFLICEGNECKIFSPQLAPSELS